MCILLGSGKTNNMVLFQIPKETEKELSMEIQNHPHTHTRRRNSSKS